MIGNALRWIAMLGASPILLGDQESFKRGEVLYATNCSMCHQASGMGVPPVFPPLSKSDWLMANRKRAILVLAQGLQGEIQVNGHKYNGVMPAQMLDDQQAADVLSFITNSWGNQAQPFTQEEVASARLESRFPTYEELLKENSYQALPQAPTGWVLEEVVRLNEFPSRLAGPDKDGSAFLLMQSGIVYKIKNSQLEKWVGEESYTDLTTMAHISAAGIAIGPDSHLWLSTNQRFEDSDGMVKNRVTIWRSADVISDESPKMEAWYQTVMPYGVGPYNHGVTHIAFGPKKDMWIASGSRTDSGEEGNVPNIAKTGETEMTACLWHFAGDFSHKVKAGEPEIVARGLRNPYGFAWDSAGNLLVASNGPDADLAEELNVIQPNEHYGFPYQYAEKPASERFYPHTPNAPAGLKFTHSMENLGPDGGEGSFSLSPHSAPAGIMWCGDQYPEPLRNRFLITRFGNMIGMPEDAGFDVLSVKLIQSPKGLWQAETHSVLSGLGRPIDVLDLGDGSVMILEYSRVTDQKSKLGSMPGRITRLRPE
jgi:glucose/arabinose dehydrogenase/mono/diheme cytochrome c family protein